MGEDDDVVGDDVVEDIAEVDVVEAVWATTENCAWFCPMLYPDLLAEAYTVYWPWLESMGRTNGSEYAPD